MSFVSKSYKRYKAKLSAHQLIDNLPYKLKLQNL